MVCTSHNGHVKFEDGQLQLSRKKNAIENDNNESLYSVVPADIKFMKSIQKFQNLIFIFAVSVSRGFWCNCGVILSLFGIYMVQSQQNSFIPRPDDSISHKYLVEIDQLYIDIRF